MNDVSDFYEWYEDSDGHFTPSSPEAWDEMLDDADSSAEYWTSGLDGLNDD